jgi:CRISPR/Cas system CSM-associated protein Csm3 (group 7 of RAMP superfamily)
MTSPLFKSREIIERVFIGGALALETPAHFGNGDAEGLTDIPLLRDPYVGLPLLTGTSIAGALRNYLREIEMGYQRGEHKKGDTRAERLFGHIFEGGDDRASVQSWLIVEDARGEDAGIELRDGVAIDPKTRTADEHKKYDVELLAAGTCFPLRFEFLLTERNAELLPALAQALQGFEDGKIGLGQRKRRGYGRCRVNEWQVRRFKVTTPAGLIGWLNDDVSTVVKGPHIAALLNTAPDVPDQRCALTLTATLRVASSLLIRSGSGIGSGADTVHLRSKRKTIGRATEIPILSGTSLAGALRGRALRIANTVAPTRASTIVDEMFGKPKRTRDEDDQPRGSRVLVTEAEFVKPLEPALVASRVKIDRFTGGAYPQALFSEQPLYGTPDTTVRISLILVNPQPAEAGLLLLVFKDLWTGDLPLGGESSIGRGRMSGVEATVDYSGKTWTFTQKDSRLEISADTQELQECVDALKEAK